MGDFCTANATPEPRSDGNGPAGPRGRKGRAVIWARSRLRCQAPLIWPPLAPNGRGEARSGGEPHVCGSQRGQKAIFNCRSGYWPGELAAPGKAATVYFTASLPDFLYNYQSLR